MNIYRNTDKDIHKRIYLFVLHCYRDVIRKITISTTTRPIVDQLVSSITSVGANDQEADATLSGRDFVAKYSIVKIEAKETLYWLTFVRDSSLISASIIDPYINECDQIVRIVSAIIQKARK